MQSNLVSEDRAGVLLRGGWQGLFHGQILARKGRKRLSLGWTCCSRGRESRMTAQSTALLALLSLSLTPYIPATCRSPQPGFSTTLLPAEHFPLVVPVLLHNSFELGLGSCLPPACYSNRAVREAGRCGASPWHLFPFTLARATVFLWDPLLPLLVSVVHMALRELMDQV